MADVKMRSAIPCQRTVAPASLRDKKVLHNFVEPVQRANTLKTILFRAAAADSMSQYSRYSCNVRIAGSWRVCAPAKRS